LKRSVLLQLPVFIATRTVINTAVRMVYPLLPVFGRGLGVDLQMLSFALTLRAASGIFGPFLASVADSRGRKAGMVFGLTLFISGMGMMAVGASYPAFVLMLILSLTGNFVFIPSMQAYLGDRVPYRRRGAVLAATELSWSLGFIIGVPAVSWLIANYGWRSPFPILAGLGLAALAVLAILLPKEARDDAQQGGLLRNLRSVFTYAPALGGILLAVAISASNELVNLIFGVWMEDTYQVALASLAVAALIIGVGELGGELLVSVSSDTLGKRWAISIGLAVNSAAVVLLSLSGRSLGLALAGLFLFYISFEFALVSSIPLMTEVLPAARATFMATFIAGISLGRALGAILSPALYRLGQAASPLPSISFIALGAIGLNLCALSVLGLVKPAADP
jgi:predicted MFS family arabinose efflux permease